MEGILEALATTGTLIWYTLWAFILGYLLSAILQVLVTREQMSRVLGEYGAKEAGLSVFFVVIVLVCVARRHARGPFERRASCRGPDQQRRPSPKWGGKRGRTDLLTHVSLGHAL